MWVLRHTCPSICCPVHVWDEAVNAVCVRRPSYLRRETQLLLSAGGSEAETYYKVDIDYCPGCKWMLRAAWIAQELLTTFQVRGCVVMGMVLVKVLVMLTMTMMITLRMITTRRNHSPTLIQAQTCCRCAM